MKRERRRINGELMTGYSVLNLVLECSLTVSKTVTEHDLAGC